MRLEDDIVVELNQIIGKWKCDVITNELKTVHKRNRHEKDISKTVLYK